MLAIKIISKRNFFSYRVFKYLFVLYFLFVCLFVFSLFVCLFISNSIFPKVDNIQHLSKKYKLITFKKELFVEIKKKDSSNLRRQIKWTARKIVSSLKTYIYF